MNYANIAPFINEVFYVTSAQPYYPEGDPHGGLDISTGVNSPVYSMVNGTVLYSTYNTGGYGNCIITQDDTTGVSFLYGHLRDLPLVPVGGHVQIGQQVGIEGTTGTSTGIHLHVEIQYLNPGDPWNWSIPYLDRPYVATYMGIPNVYGAVCYYDGTPVPPTPTPTTKRTKFPWVLYARKFRARNEGNFQEILTNFYKNNIIKERRFVYEF